MEYTDEDIEYLNRFHNRVRGLIFSTYNDMDLGIEIRKLKEEFDLICFVEKFRHIRLNKKPIK